MPTDQLDRDDLSRIHKPHLLPGYQGDVTKAGPSRRGDHRAKPTTVDCLVDSDHPRRCPECLLRGGQEIRRRARMAVQPAKTGFAALSVHQGRHLTRQGQHPLSHLHLPVVGRN